MPRFPVAAPAFTRPEARLSWGGSADATRPIRGRTRREDTQCSGRVASRSPWWLCSGSARGRSARGRMAEPAGEDRRRLRTGSADQFGRLMAVELSAAFRQQFFVENRPGNSGAIGSAQVARGGRRIHPAHRGLRSPPHRTGDQSQYRLRSAQDFTHIAMIGADSYAWAANPALGVKSIAELVMLAKDRKVRGQNPITSSSPRPGSLGHLLIEQFKRKAGIDIQRARAELRHHRRPGQSHRDDAHCHDDRRRAGQGRPARGACRHLDRAQSGVQGHPDFRRAGISRRARGYLVLAVRPKAPRTSRTSSAWRPEAS